MHQQLCEFQVDFGPKVHEPHQGFLQPQHLAKLQ